MPDTIKPILIMTWGNPSRGDDALGPLMHDALIGEAFDNVEILTDFQLQIEYTVDMQHRDRIVFVDASVSAKTPFEFYRLRPAADESYTTHAMSPQSLLATYEKVNRSSPPPAYMLSVRGYDFELGSTLTERASANLAGATAFLMQLVTAYARKNWDSLVSN